MHGKIGLKCKPIHISIDLQKLWLTQQFKHIICQQYILGHIFIIVFYGLYRLIFPFNVLGFPVWKPESKSLLLFSTPYWRCGYMLYETIKQSCLLSCTIDKIVSWYNLSGSYLICAHPSNTEVPHYPRDITKQSSMYKDVCHATRIQ